MKSWRKPGLSAPTIWSTTSQIPTGQEQCATSRKAAVLTRQRPLERRQRSGMIDSAQRVNEGPAHTVVLRLLVGGDERLQRPRIRQAGQRFGSVLAHTPASYPPPSDERLEELWRRLQAIVDAAQPMVDDPIGGRWNLPSPGTYVKLVPREQAGRN